MKEQIINGIKYRLDEDNLTAAVTYLLEGDSIEDYVGDIKISVIVPTAGTSVEIPYKTINATETSHTLTQLPGGDYAYQVVVKRTKDFLTYTSNYSNRVEVKLLGTDVENISSEETTSDLTRKIFLEGELIIQRGNKSYTVLGQEL